MACCQILCDAGADPNAQDAHGRTPLHLCMPPGYSACVVHLYNAGIGKKSWCALRSWLRADNVEVVSDCLLAARWPRADYRSICRWSLMSTATYRVSTCHLSLSNLRYPQPPIFFFMALGCNANAYSKHDARTLPVCSRGFPPAPSPFRLAEHNYRSITDIEARILRDKHTHAHT